MGRARDRRLALAAGQPLPEDLHRCPRCGSQRTSVEPAPPMAMSHVATPHGICLDCKTIWEAFPDDWSHDAVGAPPCDNCAFARGSPETKDREGWRELLADLRGGREFKCHKGAPILIEDDGATIGFDEEWVRAKGRSCAGFVRALQQWPDWLANRYPELAAALNEEVR